MLDTATVIKEFLVWFVALFEVLSSYARPEECIAESASWRYLRSLADLWPPLTFLAAAASACLLWLQLCHVRRQARIDSIMTLAVAKEQSLRTQLSTLVCPSSEVATLRFERRLRKKKLPSDLFSYRYNLGDRSIEIYKKETPQFTEESIPFLNAIDTSNKALNGFGFGPVRKRYLEKADDFYGLRQEVNAFIGDWQHLQILVNEALRLRCEKKVAGALVATTLNPASILVAIGAIEMETYDRAKEIASKIIVA